MEVSRAVVIQARQAVSLQRHLDVSGKDSYGLPIVLLCDEFMDLSRGLEGMTKTTSPSSGSHLALVIRARA